MSHPSTVLISRSNGDGTLVLTFGRVTSQDGRCTCHMSLPGRKTGRAASITNPIHPARHTLGMLLCPFKFQFDTLSEMSSIVESARISFLCV
ncbi:hypothetical protein NPIL_544241 [Nephila pilipes]|uniref:Uncharacterized protein n=1 Tax=Nephila pilipes TaxID=299642 RepID=A0A8X6TZI8_NEPPI|nr:hypothetical protein NPIL_544241 [Nephila pilipes]